MLLVDIADREEFAGFVQRGHVAHAHSARSDDRSGEDLTGRGEAIAAEDVAGENRQGSETGDRSFEEVASGEGMFFIHWEE